VDANEAVGGRGHPRAGGGDDGGDSRHGGRARRWARARQLASERLDQPTCQEATAAERRSYILGITDGLRLAAMFNPAQVNLGFVAQCVQRMSAKHLTRRVGGHLDGLPIEVDEPTLHFHVWYALVATCRDHARHQG
jgi:hypothetical protein